MTIPCNKFEQLLGFNFDLTGFDCRDDIDPADYDRLREQWVYPFKPGCGAQRASDCAAAKQLAKVHEAPEWMQ